MRRSDATAKYHTLSIRHRAMVEAATLCGCFYCEATFTPSDILDWVDGPDGAGETALCPRCGIDSVLPSPPVPVTPELLKEMRAAWFDEMAV